MADLELIASIHRVEKDIRETRDRIKATNEQFAEALSELPEYKAAQEASTLAKTRRTELQEAAADDADLSAWRASMDEDNEKLKDLREILSLHLVQYREQAPFVEIEDSTKVRPILLSAKLGKPEFHQEEMRLEDRRKYETKSDQEARTEPKLK